MKELFRNPHTFDMNDYYTGNIVVLGGRDFEREEKENTKEVKSPRTENKKSIELDWSFLKKTPSRAK
jgi:hypothetical protein